MASVAVRDASARLQAPFGGARPVHAAQPGRTSRLEHAGPERLYDRYNRDFECVTADRPDLLERAYGIRYAAYCVENAYENPAEHPEQLEMDMYDPQSVHCLLNFRPTGDAIGTVRLVLSREDRPSFSMKHLMEYYGRDIPVPAARTAEVSRFCISKSLRRRKTGTLSLFSSRSAGRQTEPLTSLGLIQGLVRLSVLENITHWVAIMEPQLLRLLAAMGINFIPVGAMMEYHGLRQLCYCEVESVLANVLHARPSFWEILTDGGTLRPEHHDA